MKGKVETVSIDRIKPAHFECEPETGTKIQRKTQPKTTNSKTAEIARKTRRDRKRSSSTYTPKSVTKTQTSKPTSPAITPQPQATRAHLPRQPTPYSAAFSNPRCFSR